MTPSDIQAVRNLTRLALPSDDIYIYRLGVALYTFASLSSFMTEIASHLDPAVDRTNLQAQTGGVILGAFRKCIKASGKSNPAIAAIGQKAADAFEELNSQRSDIVHSYPITNGTGAQILHRRLDSKGKYFEVTNDFLDDFISKLHDVSSKLYEIRKIVRPDLGD